MAQSLKDYLKNPPLSPVELCGCGCGEPLEKNDPAGPQYMGVKGQRVLVNSDCFFDALSDEIDKHPIGGLGMNGPGCKSEID